MPRIFPTCFIAPFSSVSSLGRMLGLCLWLLGTVSALVAQAPQEGAPLRIGLNMMGNSYLGDLTVDEGEFLRFNPGGSLALQFEGRSALQPMLTAGYGRFREQIDELLIVPPPQVTPNTFVETNFFFTDFRLQYFFLRKRNFRPFLSAGVGMLFFSPLDQEGNFLGENIFTRLEEEFYNTTVATFPMSVGAEFRLNQVIAVRGSFTQRFTSTDYLDNISLLGTAEGNDVLRHFQVGVFFTLLPKEQLDLPPERIPSEDIPLRIVTFAPEADPVKAVLIPSRLPVEIVESQNNSRLEQLMKEELERIRSGEDPFEALIQPQPSFVLAQQKREQSAVDAGALIEYTVRKTDRLPAIARRFGVSVEQLRTLNELSGEASLVAGQTLTIPDLSKVMIPPPPPSEDTVATNELDALLGEEETLVNWLALEEAALKRGAYLFMFVKKAENLQDLAKRYHLRLETILQLNYLDSPQLEADTYLRLPNTGFIE